MGLGTDDIKYFDNKFSKLHGRIDVIGKTVSEAQTQIALTNNEVGHVKEDLSCHIKKPCKNINEHSNTWHSLSWGRVLKTVAVIVGIIGTTVGVMALFLL
ncbi:hypothetical protein LCGC14_0825540 [marine sediment metagenome]|uniref:Uncharacterized protein n=1 Tax=marine sediment metagenome TaxID=412755 RepID=A0A0F9PMB7_9ZZZZ